MFKTKPMLPHMDGRRDRQNIQNILCRHHPSLPPGRFSIHLPDAPQVHIARLAALGLSQGRICLALQPLSLLAGRGCTDCGLLQGAGIPGQITGVHVRGLSLLLPASPPSLTLALVYLIIPFRIRFYYNSKLILILRRDRYSLRTVAK